MKEYKKEFIKFLIRNNSLQFGEFTLKSGRKSPYFLNTGMLCKGSSVDMLGSFYAAAVNDNVKDDFDLVFGPAYKGIPLAVAAVNHLYTDFKKDVFYSFNRKEIKDHGDRGLFVGKKIEPEHRIVIVDDVITAGTAVREVISLLKESGNPQIVSVIISVDREERGKGKLSAVQELSEEYGIKFFPVVTISEVYEFLENNPVDGRSILDKEKIEDFKKYRDEYGV